MPDHNIYLHTIGGGGGGESPTSAWENGGSQETQSQSSSGALGFITRSAMYLSNPDSLVSSAFSKAFSAGIAFATAKIVTSVALNVFQLHADWYALYSGDHSQSVMLNDVRESFNNVFQPISTAFENKKRNVAYRMTDMRNSMKMELLGDSALNAYGRRGI